MRYIVLLLLVTHQMFSQQVIKTSENIGVSVFFESKIINAKVGGPNFEVFYDDIKPTKLAIVKGFRGKNSNLMVHTEDNKFYSILLKYIDDVEKLTYHIQPSESVGTTLDEKLISEADTTNYTLTKEKKSTLIKERVQKGEYIAPVKDESSYLYNTDRMMFYKRHCSNLSNKKSQYKRTVFLESKVMLKLKNIKYNRNELYFIFELNNKSSLDYDINYVKIFKQAKVNNKRSADQIIAINKDQIVFKYNEPKRVKAKNKVEFIYVLKKFSINDDKNLIVEVSEQNGERNLFLNIAKGEVNNPN